MIDTNDDIGIARPMVKSVASAMRLNRYTHGTRTHSVANREWAMEKVAWLQLLK